MQHGAQWTIQAISKHLRSRCVKGQLAEQELRHTHPHDQQHANNVSIIVGDDTACQLSSGPGAP